MEDRRLRVENWENKPDLAVAQNIGDIQSYIQIHCSLSEFQCTHVAVTSFFFSSRRLHTRSLRDWSSDVCSSDLANELPDQDALICGDDPRAKEPALELAGRLVGGRALDAGPRANSRALEAMTAVILNVNKQYRAHAGLKLTGIPGK